MTSTTKAADRAGTLMLRYTQQLDELMHAARLYQRSTRKHQIYKGLGALVIFLGAWLTLTAGLGLGPGLLFVLGAFLWLDPVPLVVLAAGYRRSVALREPYETVIDERGTHFTIGSNRVSRPWDRYTGYLESDRVFVLVFGRWAYSVIPKRALAGPEQVERLRGVLREKIRAQR
ncbi:MAG TPA: YcxB family protein [Roseiflexaceae bacterium]|nr:YcxB family protein [Roseiflexaceae bacterium]